MAAKTPKTSKISKTSKTPKTHQKAKQKEEFRPTWLYVKRHKVTGVYYFGKTFGDPYTYNGSGFYWKNHLKKYGDGDLVETLWVRLFKDEDKLTRYALRFSKRNDIVEARRPDGKKKWANLVFEDGVSGGYPAGSLSDYSREKIRSSHTGKVFHTDGRSIRKFIPGDPEADRLGMTPGITQTMSDNLSKTSKGRSKSQESIAKMKATKKANPRTVSAEEREAASKRMSGKGNPMYGRTHTDEVKARLSRATTRQLLEKNPMHDPEVAKKCGSARIGKKWYNDGHIMYQLFPDDPKIRKLRLVAGMLPNQVGWKRYNDGVRNYSCPPDDPRIKRLKLKPGLIPTMA